jgi:tetratricopeptide (TPR) repeat protein
MALGSVLQELGRDAEASERPDEARVHSEGATKHFEEAESHYLTSLGYWKKIQDQWGQTLSSSHLGELFRRKGIYDKALEHLEAAYKIQQAAGDEWGRAWSLKGLGDVARDQQKFDEAASNYLASFTIHCQIRRFPLAAKCVDGLLEVAERLGRRTEEKDDLRSSAARLRVAADQQKSREKPEMPLNVEALVKKVSGIAQRWSGSTRSEISGSGTQSS